MNLIAQTKVVDLVLPGQQPAAAHPSVWWIMAGLAIAAIVAVILVARRRMRRYDPAEAAFRTLARAAGLKRRERTKFREAAQAAGAAPAAMLISAAARDRILEAARSANSLPPVGRQPDLPLAPEPRLVRRVRRAQPLA
jgi:hypothetical protein